MTKRETVDLDALYRGMAARVVALGLHLTGDRDAAEDVLQEAFLAAYRGRRGFRGQCTPETWVYRIAIHAALRMRRRRRRGRQREWDAARVQGETPSPADEDGERTEQALRVREALDRLSETDRVVLSLQSLRGLSTSTIAQILSVPEGTVHSRAYNARRPTPRRLGGAPGDELSSDADTAGRA